MLALALVLLVEAVVLRAPLAAVMGVGLLLLSWYGHALRREATRMLAARSADTTHIPAAAPPRSGDREPIPSWRPPD